MAKTKAEEEAPEDEITESGEDTSTESGQEQHEFTPIGRVAKNMISTQIELYNLRVKMAAAKDELKEMKKEEKQLASDLESHVATLKYRRESFTIEGEQFSLDDYLED